MNTRAILRLFSFLLSAFIANSAVADELNERGHVMAETGQLLRAENYAALEELAERYRTEESRTSSGAWKLALFYDGMRHARLDIGVDDKNAWRASLSQYDVWASIHPDSPTPIIARAAALMGRGWVVRGEGVANDVSMEHMKQFRDLALETMEYLLQHSELRNVDPHWYALMADASRATGVNRQNFLNLYEEGLDRYPDYDPLIFIAGGYLSPRWGGSLDDVEMIARYTAEQTEEQRDFAPYARIYWVAGYQHHLKKYAFDLPGVNWDDMVRGMDAVLGRYPSQWNIQHFAFFACVRGDAESTARYFEMVGKSIPMKIWGNVPYYEYCKRKAQSWHDNGS